MCSRSETSRCLWSVLLAITTAACVCLIYVYLENQDKQEKNPSHFNGASTKEKLSEEECIPVCDSKECLIFSKFLLSNMKENADPCENIHTFACGAYEEKYSMEERSSMDIDASNKMYDVLDDILRNIKADPESASGKLKIMYDSCVDYVSTEKFAFPTAQKFLDDIGIADWPHLAPNFQFRDTDIPTILGKLKAGGELIFLLPKLPKRYIVDDYPPLNEIHNITVGVDTRYLGNLLGLYNKSSAIHILKFFDLDIESIEEIWCNYETVRKSMLKLAEESCYNITKDLMCLDDQKMKTTDKERCNYFKSYCPVMFEEDDWITDGCDSNLNCSNRYNDSTYLCKFFEVFLNNSNLRENYRINPDFINLHQQDFVKDVIPLLKNFTDRAVADFLILNFYLNHLGELNFYFQRTNQKYFAQKRCEFYNPPAVLDRWRVCTKWMIDNMFFAAQYEFLKNYLTLEENKKILDMYEEIKSEVREVVSRQTWMLEQDKKILNINGSTLNLEQLKEIQSHPLEYERSVDNYYKSFHPTGKNFFQDSMELRRTMSLVHMLLAPIDLFLLGVKFINNAYSYIWCNTVAYHFGKLVPTNYFPGLPRVINLFPFAAYAIHEIGHRIDFTIRDVFEPIDNKTEENWKERSGCLTNQFSQFKYEFEDKNLNGAQYLYENVADNIFTLIIDKIMEKHTSAHEEILLPGFSYSFKQIAYISINELFCSKVSDNEEWYYRMNVSVHSPLKLRSIGPMQNSKGFSEAFNCPEGTYMNPSTKCAVLDDV